LQAFQLQGLYFGTRERFHFGVEIWRIVHWIMVKEERK
jgi:hypothetical protein